MSNYRDYRNEAKNRWETRAERRGGHSHIWTGLFLVLVGGIALVKSFGVPVPAWLFSWQMLLIGIGFFIGLKKGFGDGGWFVPILVGGAFLINDYVLQGDLRRHLWPLILIVLGLVFLIRSRRSRFSGGWAEKKNGNVQTEPIVSPLNPGEEEYTEDSFVNSTCIFSGAKKVILSKNFKGGDLVNIFGGCEIDLTQADLTTPAVLEVTAIFGGATLIVPSNWAIKQEAITIFGGINDKRKIMPMTETPAKTLVLKGTMIFGGMEIKSY